MTAKDTEQWEEFLKLSQNGTGQRALSEAFVRLVHNKNRHALNLLRVRPDRTQIRISPAYQCQDNCNYDSRDPYPFCRG